MKIKLDENLHIALAEVLRTSAHDVETVADEDLLGASDAAVLRAATTEDRLLITLDRGFGDLRTYPPGSHAGILVLRLDDHSLPGVKVALDRLLGDKAFVDLAGCVAVFRDGALRVRRPSTD